MIPNHLQQRFIIRYIMLYTIVCVKQIIYIFEDIKEDINIFETCKIRINCKLNGFNMKLKNPKY